MYHQGGGRAEALPAQRTIARLRKIRCRPAPCIEGTAKQFSANFTPRRHDARNPVSPRILRGWATTHSEYSESSPSPDGCLAVNRHQLAELGGVAIELEAAVSHEVEHWLRNLGLARASCAEIRNLMSIPFNHARRYDLFAGNPISLVRQSVKRRKIPELLGVDELRRLLQALGPRDRTMVLMAAGTGLRMSELFVLKWRDVDFRSSQISVNRSIVEQVVGPCKTEAAQKPVPLDSCLAKALRGGRRRTRFRGIDDWIFASPHTKGRKPYRGQPLMRYCIQPAGRRVGITKQIGWHTFRHPYSTLRRSEGVDIKVVQELLRHASCRVTMDTYTQAVTTAKRKAQSSVVGRFTARENPPA